MLQAGKCAYDFDVGDVEVWPECAEAWELFSKLRTQWNYGPVGPAGLGGPQFAETGLNYLVLFRLLDDMRLDPVAREELFNDVRYCEAHALRALARMPMEDEHFVEEYIDDDEDDDWSEEE